VTEDTTRPKFYVLNMFPYPSGAGLHVGHPLGYIASDIYARYKRLQGFNVLNPMGYDAYGLPAEQYAIQTGQHPEKTTVDNINRYREQLDKIGFSFDWSREVRTCDPAYYHWTQWAFELMFDSYYDTRLQQAQPISRLTAHLAAHGTEGLTAAQSEELHLTAAEWAAMTDRQQSETLMNWRLAFRGETMVNWCPQLGTVLANDEVVDGVSERGGYPVVQKKMSQWMLRVSAYAQRLLDGLDTVEWTESLKETQRNWIGRSEGTEVEFKIRNGGSFTIFTTRADTMFGVTFMVLAPESELVEAVTTDEQRAAVAQYLDQVKKRTERERIINKTVSGVFTGAYAVNPLTGEDIPVWVSDYVLAGYGTGAIMAVPAHDSRDYAFARHFGLPIVPLIEGADVSEESYDAKEGIVMNSPAAGKTAALVLNGLSVKEAIAATKKYVSENGLGRVKVNYRLRDAIFSRQRYWGEPFPVYYKHGIPTMVPADCLPLLLPEVDKFLPTETGEPPLGNATTWAWDEAGRKVVENSRIDDVTVFPLELNTMPGFAGSSAYYLRYMDPHNTSALVGEQAVGYWQNVDLYVGGTEHATGHLIYSRFWNKVLFDFGYSAKEEPFQKLINQGMIQGRSNFVYRVKDTNTFVSAGLRKGYDTTPIHVDVNIVSADVLDVEAFRQWRPEYNDAEFILEDGKYICGWAVEKMSKSMFNVVNPDNIVERFGADTLRLYEMFLGPVEASKPWDTNGIDGCHRFLKKFWMYAFDKDGHIRADGGEPSKEALRSIHKLIKKVTADIENFSYNTSIAAFMICLNELNAVKCTSRAVLEDFVVLLSPFCPHLCEELWEQLGHEGSVVEAQWPACNEAYLVEETLKLTVSFNGKARFQMEFPADASNEDIERAVLADPQSAKYMEGLQHVKPIVVPKKIVNIVLKSCAGPAAAGTGGAAGLAHARSIRRRRGKGPSLLRRCPRTPPTFHTHFSNTFHVAMTLPIPPISTSVKQEIHDYTLITLALCMYAFGLTCFMLPYQITTGGVAGISSIIYFATGFEVQWTYLFINVAFLVAAVIELGWRFCIRTIYAVLMLTFITWAFQRIFEDAEGNLPRWVGDEAFMACVIGDIIEGAGLAICFSANGSTGGTDIIAAIVNKYKNISLGNIIMFCDIIIISSCYFVFHDPRRMVFGYVCLILSALTLDYMLNRRRQSVQFLIFSRNYRRLADEINSTGRGVTVLDGTGWYTKTERKVLVVIAKKSESMNIFRLIKYIDPYCFISMSNAQGVYGEGFDKIKAKQLTNKHPLVFATNNAHKLEEVRAMLGDLFEIRSLDDINCHAEIPETGNTFAENALLKAQYVKRFYGFDCFADDSGLEVEALGGAPGVHSARYASEEGHDAEANMTKLLHEMEGKENRRANFRTVIAFVSDLHEPKFFEGRIEGQILTERRGEGGFGYDPLFVPDGYDITFAEMTAEQKNAISHRGQAMASLVDYLNAGKA
jgi:leucyl-tRNA synthetase